MSLTFIDSKQVRQLLPMSKCIELMVPAMIAATKGTLSIPPRLIMPLIDNSGYFALMPGSSKELEVFGAKVISLMPGNAERGLPGHMGFVTLFNHSTGEPLAIVEGAELTAIRTAATSGLATRELSRKDARSCGIFGTGVQAKTHIDAMRAVRNLDEIIVSGHDFNQAVSFANEQTQRTGMFVRASEDPAETAGCDLVCTVTSSPHPVLQGKWIKPGTHINLVGAHSLKTREADTEVITKSLVYVDLLDSVRNEGGDVMIPIQEGAATEDHIIGELGQLLEGEIAGRDDANQITLFNSLGVIAQDLFAAKYVYESAIQQGVGKVVEF